MASAAPSTVAPGAAKTVQPIGAQAGEYQPGASDVYSYSFGYKDSVVVPKKAIVMMKNRIESELSMRNMLASSDSKAYNRIEIIFNGYNMRSGGARVGVGIFAGTDIINTLVLVKGKDSDNILAEFTVESKNYSAWGTSKGMIEKHADKIVKYLAGGKK